MQRLKQASAVLSGVTFAVGAVNFCHYSILDIEFLSRPKTSLDVCLSVFLTPPLVSSDCLPAEDG